MWTNVHNFLNYWKKLSYAESVHRLYTRLSTKKSYFPMQKLENISPNKSSANTLPVISPNE